MLTTEQTEMDFQSYLDAHIINAWQDSYIPYETITKNASTYYMRMLRNLEKENADLRIFYYGKNKHYDEFIEKVNEELMKGVQIVS